MNHPELIGQLPQMTALGMIDVDSTSLVSALIFVVMLVLLNQLLFQPYLRILRDRERLTTGAQAGADETLAAADAAMAEYEAKLASARSEASSLREELRRTGSAQEGEILSGARDKAARSLEARRAALATELARAEAEIETRASAISAVIVQKVMS